MKTYHSTALSHSALMIGLLVLAFSVSCKKSPETIGNNLISDNNYIGMYHTDTLQVYCHSYLDSVGTTRVTNALLGGMFDPVFGHSEAGFYTQFRPSSTGQSFGNDAVLDSVVLQLCLTSYYGDTSTLQTAHAYMLTDSLSMYESYYNHSTIPTEAIDLANGYQFRPHPRTALLNVGTDTINRPIIRIPLDATLGNYLIGLDTTAFTNADLFKELFKGLYVTCEPVGQGGAISYINLTNNSYTMLQLYYHNLSTPDHAKRYNFYVTTSDSYFNHIDHDYTTGDAAFVQQLIEGDTLLGQEVLYLQTMGGVRTRLWFPNLPHWADTLEDCHLLINDAKLILSPSPLANDTAILVAPKTFVLLGFNEDGTSYLLPDYYEGNNYFGGTYDSNTNTVTFRISEYIQTIIMNNKPNAGLSLGINGAGFNAQRWVLNGPAAENPMRIEITYSIVQD